MTLAIYRAYRPSTFGDVTDQAHIKTTLQNEIVSGKLSHAYLFAGPRGVGKTTVARLLAKSVNCTGRKANESEPCNSCESCNEQNAGAALDVIEIDAASNTGVDNVRDNIIESVRFAPTRGKYKVFIIDEAHMLSTQAFNALLKTLEEPPAHAIFILATTELHKIPSTILSRCERYDFRRIAADDIVRRLATIAKAEKVKVSEDVLRTVARLSEGCLRDAESLFGQLLALGEKEIGKDEASIILPVTNTATVLDVLEALARGSAGDAVETLNTFVDQGGSPKQLTDELIDAARNALLLSLGGTAHDHYERSALLRLEKVAQELGATRGAELIDRLLAARVKTAPEAMAQLPLELMFVEFVGQKRGLALQEVEEVKRGDHDDTNTTPTPSINGRVSGQPDSAPPVATFTIEDLREKWKRCCEAVGKRNIALPLVLTGAEPQTIEGDQLVVGFRHKFHFETVREPKNASLLAAGINEIMQSNIVVTAVFLGAQVDESLGELASAFGGKVVE